MDRSPRSRQEPVPTRRDGADSPILPCCRMCVMGTGLSLAQGLGMSSQKSWGSTELLQALVEGPFPTGLPRWHSCTDLLPALSIPLLPALLGQGAGSFCKTQTATGHSDCKVIGFVWNSTPPPSLNIAHKTTGLQCHLEIRKAKTCICTLETDFFWVKSSSY